MSSFGKYVVLCLLFGVVTPISRNFFDFAPPASNLQPNVCLPGPLGRVEWILHVRQSDYGWKEHTHRANIALAVNKWKGAKEEMTKMELRLEEEIIKYLLRNRTSVIYENDLALFIHALIATNKNPRNFHGTDLVADLLHHVNSMATVHPFLVLALCNSHAVEFSHLQKIQTYTYHDQNEGQLKPRDVEMKALALKTLACAANLERARELGLNKFGANMEAAAKYLVSKQKDGIFGNAYTTSLAVQALTAYENGRNWNERKALKFLEKESITNVNIIKAYYIEMALNSRRVKFIKDLHTGTIEPETLDTTPRHYVKYSIKEDHNPDVYFSLTMKVPAQSNFFEIMKMGSELSDRYRFSHYYNQDNEPMVYAVAGTPNDAEENMFWRICLQSDIGHDRDAINITTSRASPVRLIPEEDQQVTLWYRNSDCS